MSQATTDSRLSSLREVALWGTVGLLYAGLAVGSLSFAVHFTTPLLYLTVSRMILAGLALTAAANLLRGRVLPVAAVSTYFFLALGIQSTHALLEGPERAGLLQLTALLFVCTSAVFQSSRRDWLVLFLPLCATLLFVPAFFKQDLVHSLLLATAALVLGQGIAWVRLQRESAEEASAELLKLLESKIALLKSLQDELQKEGETMKKQQSIEEAISRIRSVAEQKANSYHDSWVAPDASKGEGRVYSLPEILTMMDGLLHEKREEHKALKRVSMSWARTIDPNLPVLVQINSDDLNCVIGSLIDQAIESLAGNEGVVRLGLHPGLRQIQITVEDNGRGMNEDILVRVQERGLPLSALANGRLSFQQIHALVRFWGGRVYRQARLGVGSRVTVELPRVDAYATPFAVARGGVAHEVARD